MGGLISMDAWCNRPNAAADLLRVLEQQRRETVMQTIKLLERDVAIVTDWMRTRRSDAEALTVKAEYVTLLLKLHELVAERESSEVVRRSEFRREADGLFGATAPVVLLNHGSTKLVLVGDIRDPLLRYQYDPVRNLPGVSGRLCLQLSDWNPMQEFCRRLCEAYDHITL